MSAFSSIAPAFEVFLLSAKDALALGAPRHGDSRNARFIPRNFLLEEKVDPVRAAAYADALARRGPISFENWTVAHNDYLRDRVFVTPPDMSARELSTVAIDDPTLCPETFRSSVALSAFQGTDLDTYFIRLVSVADLAWRSGAREDEIFALSQSVARDPETRSPEATRLAHIFEEAFLGPKSDHRPVFAAFYEDFLDELKDASDPNWANQLRDRLGLFHLHQWSASFPHRVLLFHYKVEEIPMRRGEPDKRPVARPVVLDSRFFEAFCPAPRELTHGQLLNLAGGTAKQTAREVLHLFMPLEPRHLFRVGMIDAPVPAYLGPARNDHLSWLRMLSDRRDYAHETDADLSTP